MGNIFDEDFRDFISALNDQKVEYILVGGFSVILYGYSRTTGDLDIWVKKNVLNYDKIVKAFEKFGMPLFDMTKENFLNHPTWDVFTFGRSPVAIDIMTAVKGLDFDETFKKAKFFNEDGLLIRTIHKNDLIKAKKASNRPKDQDDLENITGK
jgi:hypothetical protein